jgi:hypothetical protein
VQLFVSEELRGRVMSTYQLASIGMMPIGALTVGFMGHTLGPRQTVVMCGVVTILSGIVLVTWLKSVGNSDPASETMP